MVGWGLLAPSGASAQCAPDPDDATLIVCDGLDSDGFDAGAVDDLSLRVNDGATVQNGAASAAIRLNDGDGTNDVRVESGGTVDADGAGSAGIQVGSDHQDVIHFGDMTVDGDASVGMEVGDGNTSVGNADVGTIQVTGTGAVGIRAGDDNGQVVNAGTLRILGDDGIAIDVGNGNEVFNLDPNDTDPGILITGANGIGILAGDDNDIDNQGTITVTDPGGRGIVVGVPGGTLGNRIVNSGTIEADSDAVSFEGADAGTPNSLTNNATGSIESLSGRAVVGGAGLDTVTNRGALVGDVDLGAGDDVFQLGSVGSFTGAIEGGADDFGTTGVGDAFQLIGSGVATVDLVGVSGFETLELVSGTWTPRNGSFSQGTTLSGGTLQLDDTVNLTGALTHQMGSTLSIGIDPIGTSGQLLVDGDIVIDPGAMLAIIERNPIETSGVFPLVSSTTSITGSYDESGLPDSAVLSFGLMQDATSIQLSVDRASYANTADSSNRRAVGRVLDATLAAGPAGDLDTLLTQLDMLGNSEFQEALDSLGPEVYDAHTHVGRWVGRRFADAATQHQPICERVDLNPGHDTFQPEPCGERRAWLWAQGLGELEERDGGDDHLDFDTLGGGGVLGADIGVVDDVLLTGFLGGSHTSLDVDAVGDGDVSTVETGVAARLRRGPVEVRGVVGYGHGWHQQDREVVAGSFRREASASFDSDRVTARVEGGYGFAPNRSLRISPVGSVDYTYIVEEAFDEEDAGDLSLSVDRRQSSIVATTLGLAIDFELIRYAFVGEALEWSLGVWRNQLDVRWHATWTGADRDVDANLAGGPAGMNAIGVSGEDTPHGGLISFRSVFQPLRSRVLINTGYRGFFGPGTQIHSVGVGVEVPL